MTPKEFAQAIGTASWLLDLTAFCALLGWEEDSYAEGKFRDFTKMARLLGTFDDDTLDKIVLAGTRNGVDPRTSAGLSPLRMHD